VTSSVTRPPFGHSKPFGARAERGLRPAAHHGFFGERCRRAERAVKAATVDTTDMPTRHRAATAEPEETMLANFITLAASHWTIVGTVLAVVVVLVVLVVAGTAIWSRHSHRRKAALEVLRLLLRR